jgi:hypothetical protein
MDPNDLLGGDDSAAAEQMRAMAEALRQRRTSLGNQGAVGTLAALTGDARFGKIGQALQSNANQGMEDVQGQERFLEQAPQTRLRMALERQQAAQEQARTQKIQDDITAMQHPEARRALKMALGKFHTDVPDDTPVQVMEKILPYAEKGDTASLNRARLQEEANRNTIGAWTPEAVEAAAQMYVRTGRMPQVGNSRQGGAIRTQIANRAAQLAPGTDLAGNAASYHADTTSLSKLQQQADSLEAFEKTGLKNLDNALSKAESVVDLGSPLLNAPARKLAEMMGDPKAVAFNTARQAAVQEFGKILSGALGGTVSDSARHEVETLLKGDATVAQLRAAADVLRADAANRHQSTAEQIAAIRGRTSGTRKEGASTTTAPSTPSSSPQGSPVQVKSLEERDRLPAGTLYVGPDGKVRRKK